MRAGPLPSATKLGLTLARELAALLGGGAVSCAPADLWAASHDAWPRLSFSTLLGQTRYPPDVVAWPGDADQISAVIKFAGARRVPVVPIGGGGGGNGAALAARGGIALDLKRLSGPPRIDVAARTVDVQAGMNLARLEEALAATGMTLGALPPGVGTVGGFLATRAGGEASGQHGKAEDLLLALEAIDGTGNRLHTNDHPARGLDLAQLLLGSEGTLAVFTSARLRIAPRARAHAVLGLRFASMAGGMRALQAVMRAGFRPSITRLLDPLSAFLAGLHPSDRALPGPLRALLTSGQQEVLRTALRAPRLLNGLAEALGGHSLLLLQFDGHGGRAVEEAEEEAAIAGRICEQIGVAAALPARAVAAALNPRPVAKTSSPGGGILSAHTPADSSVASLLAPGLAAGAFVEELDVAATWEKLPAVLGAIRRAVAPHALLLARVGCAYLEGASLEAALVGPAGPLAQAANRWHRNQSEPDARPTLRPPLRPPLDDELEEELSLANLRAEQALSGALAAALDAGATLSHASGVGLARQLLLPREHGEGMRQLRALKRAFDPLGVLNPGKLLL